MIREVVSNELFTILLTIGFLVVAAARLVSPKRFEDFIIVLLNNKYLKIYSRDQKFLDKFDSLLFSNLVISLAVFLNIFYQFKTNSTTVSINLMVKLAIGVMAFILIKVLLERLFASVFEIDKLIDFYIFQKISIKNFFGLILLPINALLLYTIKPTLNTFYVIIVLLLIINLIGLIASFKTYQSVIKNNLFYFILYLCALEIAPYVILYKVILVNNNI
ncbi:DUF4271 domain-containing protein [Neotamlana laminarinivorans]|uniref:DUF4271 domain-containing protein n=1 Tax=Neotamlana laminarinivorans TaxID=2883124 RepID=A0A9X1L1B0_9FLAO|nr:DUF4271 domain-containing protein [Tamlana laminarinivorans]MCB4798465.1 DUF4271 domain-containing protein [Tamlana laminarinivorans]